MTFVFKMAQSTRLFSVRYTRRNRLKSCVFFISVHKYPYTRALFSRKFRALFLGQEMQSVHLHFSSKVPQERVSWHALAIVSVGNADLV